MGHNRHCIEIECQNKINLFRKIMKEIKKLDSLEKIPLSYFG